MRLSTVGPANRASLPARTPPRMFFSFLQPNAATNRLAKKEEVSTFTSERSQSLPAETRSTAVALTPTAPLQLLDALKGLGRGADASEEDKARVDQLASALERVNPTKSPLGPELSAKWKLEYTTR